MGLPQTPTSPHLYPQALQLKLYQAFIFSIPILFSIILFLLFYLFYLKRRASSLSSPTQSLPRSVNIQAAASYVSSVCELGLKEEFNERLPIVLFDEELRTRDSQCCVCLGEFEIKEELLQIPSCKHVFHIDCIHHWLHSNSTCPLCRCSVLFPTTKLNNATQASGPATMPLHQHNANPHHNVTSEQQQQQQEVGGIGSSREQIMVSIEGSSGVTSHMIDTTSLPDQLSVSVENGRGSSNQEPIILHIQPHSR